MNMRHPSMKRSSFLLLLALLLPAPAPAKRLPPPVLLPVDDGTYRFVVRGNEPAGPKGTYRGGKVEAYLKKSGKLIWERYLYTIRLDPAQERDVQDVYLKKMYLGKGFQIVLQNERGKWFVLDRRTGQALDNEDFEKREDDLSIYYAQADRVEPVLKGDYLIEADDRVSWGRQKVRAYDLPTGRLLWEEKVKVPEIRKAQKGKGNRIAFLWMGKDGVLEITFWDNSTCLLDVGTGKILPTHKPR